MRTASPVRPMAGHAGYRGSTEARERVLKRIVQHKTVMQVLPALTTAAVRAVGSSLSYRFIIDSTDSIPRYHGARNIYAFWHEMLLLPAYTHGRYVVALVSRSRDGAMADDIIRTLGGGTIRASTDHYGKNRGGRTAMRHMLRHSSTHNFALAIDGPVGPRRKVASAGGIWVASRTRMPIIPVGIGANLLASVGPEGRKIGIPWPFTSAWYVFGSPIRVPEKLSKPQVREFVRIVQEAMDAVQARADRYVERGTSPEKTHTLEQMRSFARQ